MEIQPDTNFGTEPGINAGDSRQGLFHFDLSSIAAGSRVVSATLWLYVTTNDTVDSVNIHRVTADWTETGATWDAMVDAYDMAALGNIPPQSTKPVWVKVNLTAQVQAWVNGAEPNYGIMLFSNSDKGSGRFSSREWATASQRPRLEVVAGDYAASPVTITATGTLTGSRTPANDITRTLINRYYWELMTLRDHRWQRARYRRKPKGDLERQGCKPETHHPHQPFGHAAPAEALHDEQRRSLVLRNGDRLCNREPELRERCLQGKLPSRIVAGRFVLDPARKFAP